MKKLLSPLGVCCRYLPKCFGKNGKYRIKLKNYLYREKARKMKLAMTLLVKDEEELIEKNIRFHRAMGVNCFVITIHNSTDKTLSIVEQLKREGIPIEIIIANDNMGYMQDTRVDKMIKIAKKKFKADWVINADADEFYYSKDLNLRKSITKYNIGNVIEIDSTFSFPNKYKDRISNPYFITRYMPKFWYETEQNIPPYGRFSGARCCLKVIHKTKGYLKISFGNHNVTMINKKLFTTGDIVLYHFSDGNYNDFKTKVKRYTTTFNNSEQQSEVGTHVQKLIELYECGKLEEHYDSMFSDEIQNRLIELGIVTADYSLINFLKYHKI